jgi:predicted transcriptional regulator of viral defense system
MARSTYISENLTQQQIDFMLELEGHELEIFSLVELKNQFRSKFNDINELVENLVHKKILSRIEKGKYCKSTFRNEYVIGTFMARNSAIAYWSALNLHGLTEQFPNNIFVQTNKLKRNKSVFGTGYQFVKVVDYKLGGYQVHGHGNNQFRSTNVEKTITDCFDLPQYSGGYAELLRAFSEARMKSGLLTEYSQLIKNVSATKRMGFLAELLERKELIPFISHAKTIVNEKYTLFDPFGLEKGEFVNEWKLRLNITREDILAICNKQY